MILLDKVPENRQAFGAKVQQIARALRVDPNWLMLVMYHESRFNHRVINSIGCVGLIQFCLPMQQFGLTASQLANMSNLQQLDYVYKFFAPRAGQYKSFRDMHLYAFYPVAFSQRNNLSYVFGSEGNFSPAVLAQQNAIFDVNKNGSITMGEFTKYANDYASKFGVKSTSQNNVKNLILLGIFAYWLYENKYL